MQNSEDGLDGERNSAEGLRELGAGPTERVHAQAHCRGGRGARARHTCSCGSEKKGRWRDSDSDLPKTKADANSEQDKR